MNPFREIAHRLVGAPISVVHEFHRPPYGGGNQFLLALVREWRDRGYDVAANRIGARTRSVLFNSYNFDFDQLKRALRPGIRAVHRVDGPISGYRGRDREIDENIARLNHELASATVFQSQYSLDAHTAMGLSFRNPVVIMNACDSRIFFPAEREPGLPSRKIRVAASSWSDNPGKGKHIYEWIDANLDFDRYEFSFIGRIQSQFKNIKHIPAQPSEALAAILREQDIYVTASANDPCSNALIEAMACGLPSVYLRSGGHAEIAGDGGIGYDTPAEIPAALDSLVSQFDQFRSRIRITSMRETAARYMQVMKGSNDSIPG